jgi:hypothetical protein
MVLPRILERICEGLTLNAAIRELPIDVDPGAFIRWLKRDSKNYDLYKEAKEIRTEVWAGKAIEHAVAEDSVEDVARSKLIIDTYKWLMGADNRRTYGDTKSIEVTSNISITAALEQARARVISASTVADELIDVTPVYLLEDPERDD